MDEIDELFGKLDDFYPGSKRKRREPKPQRVVESTDWEDDYYTKVLPGNITLKMYTIGALAKALNRPVITIRTWIKEGYIPQSPYRLPSKLDKDGKERVGRRLYSKRMIETAVDAFTQARLFEVNRIDWTQHQQLRDTIADSWNKIREDELKTQNNESNERR